MEVQGDILGEKPRPCVLLVRESMPDDVGPQLDQLNFLPTVRQVDVSKLNSTRLAEWDAAVFANADSVALSGHMPYIHFGDGTFAVRYTGDRDREWLSLTPGSNAEQYIVADGLDSEVDRLVRDDLVPALRARQGSRPILAVSRGQGIRPMTVDEVERPFLFDGDGSVFCGMILVQGKPVWFAPHTQSPEKWVRAAFYDWARTESAHLVPHSDWMSSDRWIGASEARVRIEIDSESARFQALQESHSEIMSALNERYSSAVEEVTLGERRLLTSAGEELVDAVVTTLRILGFTVNRRDEDEDTASARLEDLIVKRGEWEAIVEVRGYGGGAQVRDVTRLSSRFAVKYTARMGRPPNAQWYVVNQFRHRAPDDRPIALSNEPEVVEEFGESGGLIVDTRDLFSIVKEVGLDRLSAESARLRLTSSICRLGYTEE